jgi:hypothetical protein
MKKILFSAAVLLGAIGICVSNTDNSIAQAPAGKAVYILNDTTPTDTMTTDTTTTTDSAFLK